MEERTDYAASDLLASIDLTASVAGYFVRDSARGRARLEISITMPRSASPQSHSAHGSEDHAQGPPRKKMRKGTKSCIECRRRKIKCTFEPGRTSICNECFARGSTCIDQELGDSATVAHAFNTLQPQSKDDQNSVLKERVTYLEDLVKQVLDRLPEKNGPPPVVPPSRIDKHSSMQADAQAGMCLS